MTKVALCSLKKKYTGRRKLDFHENGKWKWHSINNSLVRKVLITCELYRTAHFAPQSGANRMKRETFRFVYISAAHPDLWVTTKSESNHVYNAFQSVTLHTDVGDIKIEVFCEDTPKAAENFLALCASDYYSGCVFTRNIKGFMVQTGDPTNTGKGGKSIWGEKFDDEFKENLKHSERGFVSMANAGVNSNQSQFFITYSAQPALDLKYTIFGRVIDGFQALDELEKLAVNPKTYRPLADKKINSVTIHANPLAVWTL